MRDTQMVDSRMGGLIHRPAGLLVPAAFSGLWDVVARRGGYYKKSGTRVLGEKLWEDVIENIVVNQGLNHLLDVTLSGATQDTTWFVGLTDGTPTVAAGDTLASHAGWVEVTAYDEVNRVAWVDAGAASQSVSNSASPAVLTISANGTVVGGALLAGVNTGSAGTLYAAGAFSAGDKDLDDNDTLDVTATFTAAAA